jgi:hypothetical protein
MASLVLYALLTPSLFLLGSRATITRFLWSRYPSKLASFMDCSACSGTWYGFFTALTGGYYFGLPFLGLPGDSWTTVVIVGLCSTTWTPVIAGLVQHGFDTLGTVTTEDDGSA